MPTEVHSNTSIPQTHQLGSVNAEGEFPPGRMVPGVAAFSAPLRTKAPRHERNKSEQTLKGFELGPALERLARIQAQWARGRKPKPVEHFPLTHDPLTGEKL